MAMRSLPVHVTKAVCEILPSKPGPAHCAFTLLALLLSTAVSHGSSVSITSPADGAHFAAPVVVTITAAVNVTNGTVAKVEFFDNDNKLGEDSSTPYSFSWSNAPIGSHTLTARATDGGGAVSTSGVVNIVVTNGPGPDVHISYPGNGAVLLAPATFFLSTYAAGYGISHVAFYLDVSLISVDISNPYDAWVRDLQGGTYVFTAVATDIIGNKTTNRITITVDAAPSVKITSPRDGSVWIAPATFNLQATGSDSDGSISRIQFFRDTIPAGEVTTNPGSVLIKGLGVGTHNLLATAIDNHGAKGGELISVFVKNRPTVTITGPPAGARLTNVTELTGTARDSISVGSVDYSLNAGPFVATPGETSWSAQLSLPAGTNVVRVRSVDAFGNYSLTNVRSFFQVANSSLTLLTNGLGTISGATSGQSLEVGRGYRLTATAGPGYLFSNWTGMASGPSPTLGFLMRSNMMIQANFVPNPFLRVSGEFNGLFREPDQVRHGTSGDFKLIVTTAGKYSASLRMAGRLYTASGSLDLTGHATNVIGRPGTYALVIQWAVDLQGLDQVTGTVGYGSWTADLRGDRATFSAALHPAPLAGRHTLILPGDEAANAPEGDGHGTLRVTTGGIGVLAGSLADGTPFSRAAPLSRNGEWPLYAPLYSLKGSIFGWVQFDTNAPLTDFSGVVDWSKPALPAAPFYPLGFTNQTTLTGSRYWAPSGGTNRVIDITTNGVVILSGGNLSQHWTNAIVLEANNHIINSSSNKLTLTPSLATGLFKGVFTDSNVARTVKFTGVFLQKSTNGTGWFRGTNLIGRVHIRNL